ncbi:hypothetical protein [Candidatus Nitrososphaera evergladensis]|uniref:hypothetical protein n=1 Tax=Candidatus Nitrososphaera evergladensis TaxID=1459637 RepID=UPI0011E5DF35|nr:hypothetical protein [Candidatus Nitrososphaera evergladensis]
MQPPSMSKIQKDLQASAVEIDGSRRYLAATGGGAMASQILPEPAHYIPIDSTGVGCFPWYWQLPDGFNKLTYDYLDNVVRTTEQGLLALSPSFSTRYLDLLNTIDYVWSTKEVKELEGLIGEIHSLEQEIVSKYEDDGDNNSNNSGGGFGEIIYEAELEEAAKEMRLPVMTKIAYVLNYKLGYVWSGRRSQKLAPMNSKDLYETTDLSPLFLQAPPRALDIFSKPLANLFQLYRKWASTLGCLCEKSSLVQLALQNNCRPKLGNGGIVIVHPDGNKSISVGYRVLQPVNQVAKSLNDPANTLEMQISVEELNAEGGEVKVSVNKKPPLIVPGPIMQLEFREHNRIYHTFSFDGTCSQAIIKKTFFGPTVIDVQPFVFKPESQSGWLYLEPIRKAVENLKAGDDDDNDNDNDKEGYRFVLPPACDFNPGGDFGLIGSLFVCREITIEIMYPQGDLKSLSSSFPTDAAAALNVNLFGDIRIGSRGRRPLVARLSKDEQTGAPTIILALAPETVPVPLAEQLAYVIGGRVFYPGAFSAARCRKSMQDQMSPSSSSQ